jgi:hypothetical protein
VFTQELIMKMVRAAAIGLLLFIVTAAGAQSEAQKGLEKLKSLVGAWHGKTSKGEPVEDIFQPDRWRHGGHG